MSKPRITKIQFVWNADFSLAGGVNALREVLGGHHSCTLCGIAYHRVRQRAEWKAYKRELAARFPLEIREPCRNQLQPVELAAAASDYPTVLAHSGEGVVKLLSGAEIDACQGKVDAFRQRLDAAIDRLLRGGDRPRRKARTATAPSSTRGVKSAHAA